MGYHIFQHYHLCLHCLCNALWLSLRNYCIFGNFRENFIFANSVKIHISDVLNLRLGHDLPISVNNRVILPFCEDFTFAKLRICEVSRK